MDPKSLGLGRLGIVHPELSLGLGRLGNVHRELSLGLAYCFASLEPTGFQPDGLACVNKQGSPFSVT